MKRFLYILSLLLLAPGVFAATNFFTPSANDQSMYFLGTIFGDVGNVLVGWGDSTLLKYTFYYFNQAVLVLGCIVIVYTLIVSTVNTSHHGEMMGSKWNSVWIPLRSAIGFALLLPIGPGQTYAVVQAIVMWVIVQGVGAADYLWSNMVDQIVAGTATIKADTASSTSASDTVMAGFEYFVCAMEFVQVQGYKNYKTSTNYNGNTPNNSFKDNYKSTAPHVYFTTSNGTAVQPNTNFWTFGIANPTSWSVQSICGSITTPAPSKDMRKSTDPKQKALVEYYDNQRDIISNMLGLSNKGTGISELSAISYGETPVTVPGSSTPMAGTAPASNGLYTDNYWGYYGGNWIGDFGGNATPAQRCTSNPTRNGCALGLQTVDPATQKVYNLPTVAYLAELLAQQYIDKKSPTSNPTQESSPSSNAGKGNSQDMDSVQTLPSSQISDYVEQQLALIAQAYTDATAANYAGYQAAIAAPATPAAGGTQSQSNTTGPTKDDLGAAAKFNGWASAGALYLDMSKALQATTSDIATTTAYSYGALACTTGVGVSIEGHNNGMLCKDARTPPDVGGQRGHNDDKDKKNSKFGTDLGDAITQAQNATTQALGLMVGDDGDVGNDTNTGPCQNTVDSPPPAGQEPSQGYIYDNTGYYGGYQQNCGIYNSANNGAFSPNNFTKPKFPRMIINPLAWYGYVNGMMIYNFSRTITPMLNMGTAATMANPIMTLRRSGIILLNTSSKLYHVGLNYMWYSGAVSYVASAWNPLPAAAMSTFNWAASMATTMVGAMMAMGAILAYYFPMIPYLVFTFATIQWLILTIEAMTAAPLMALGILHPEGNHEVFGHSSAGIAILSSVFLRPSLMIVGYFAATLMCYVVVLLINAGFFFAAGSMFNGDTSTGSVFGCVVVWMMYLNMVMIAINKAFSLIYHIPDHVTRWIGIHEAGGSDVEQMMGKVQESAKQGGELGKGAMDGGANATMSTSSTAGQQRPSGKGKKEEKKEEKKE